MREIIKKEEIEQLVGYMITDEQFNEALKYAKIKQDYIYKQECRPIVLNRSYLVKLTEECVRILTFSKFTKNLCEVSRDIEKERSVKNRALRKYPYYNVLYIKQKLQSRTDEL